DLLRALIKMRGSVDSALVIGWLRAKRFAVSAGRVEPLCGVLAASFFRFRELSGELFEATALEVTYYTDFSTGELLDTLVMPFSGKSVDVPVHRFGPVKTRFAVSLEEQEDFKPAAGTTQDQFAPAASVRMSKSIASHYVRRDELFLRHEEYGRVYPADSGNPNMFYKESTIWSAPLRDVLNDRTTNVDARVSYSAMTSWRPWMQMADVPGFTTSNGFGGKARSLEDLPDDYLRFTEMTNPDVLEGPEALLDALEE
ncbi:MAG: DUF1838 domain-containing protein, partial [Gammaproteobacteria bacterium]|nr:DUF1838 domain-containing protein [Gammaproteobacteria bacterium]